MGDKTEDPLGIESMVKTWTKSMNDLMGGEYAQGKIPQMPFPFFQSPLQQSFESPFQSVLMQLFQQNVDKVTSPPFFWPFQSGDGSKNRTGTHKDLMDAIINAMKNWHTISGAMASPESTTALFKGIGTMPEMLMSFTQSTISGMAEIHQKMVESASRMGQSVKAYNFDNIDEDMLKVWSEIYEKEFRKFLQIPQLGLTREYQEKINVMTDKFNICQAHMADFLRILSLPFQRSAIVMQEEIKALAEKGTLSEDPQFYYQMWVKILEGHFMTLFQTPEYIDALTKTIGSMSQFNSSKQSVIEDILSNLPVASRSDLDDVAKELHQLKKEIRNLKKKIV
ncbi:MAG: hypothetical protein HQK62_05110 [Desulfamplus sp.]|nr:hypothetical protein [Desulfamplus sp.]